MVQASVQQNEKYDVAIVGGGISGLYCAMNLMNDPRTADRGIKNIVLLEASDKFGGRFESEQNGVSGAFRFVYTSPESDENSTMPLISKLVADLGMQEDVIKTPAGVLGNTVSYFGGKHVTSLDVKLNPNVWRAKLNLKDDEEISSVAEIPSIIYKRLLEHNRERLEGKYPDRATAILSQKDHNLLQKYQDPDYWMFFRNEFTWPIGAQEVLIRDLPISTMVRTMKISPGFLSLVGGGCSLRDVGSYLQNQMMMRMLMSEFHTLKNGWPSLINKMEKLLLDLNGTNGINIKLRRNCRVNSLAFAKDDSEPVGVNCDDNGTALLLSADKLVMATSPAALSNIRQGIDKFESAGSDHSSLWERCSLVQGEDMTFINLYFESDWWNKGEDEKMAGPCCSDLPCSVIRPFYSPTETSPSGLSIISSRGNAEFWTSLQRVGSPYNVCAIKNPLLTPTSEVLVEAAMEQLQEIFQCEEAPRPVMATFRKMSQDTEYGYAYYSWRVGLDSREVECAKPVPGRHLYFCHDAWSDCQGWAEGSLRSTKAALESMLEKKK